MPLNKTIPLYAEKGTGGMVGNAKNTVMFQRRVSKLKVGKLMIA
jgi:hypothetical protein